MNAFDKLIPWRRSSDVAASTRASDPFAALQARIDDVFGDFLRGFPAFDREAGGALAPRVDLSENDEEIRLEAELPGVEEKDLSVTYQDGALVIAGEKKHEQRTERDGLTTMERSYGQYRRVVAIPCEIEQDKVDASYKNGVLTVRLPKSRDARATARRIPVRGER